MSLQETLRSDLKKAMKAKEEGRTSALRVLIGEFQRQPQKELSDQQVLAIIRKMVKSEMETMAISGAVESEYLVILQSYLPREISREETRQWIDENIDFSKFTNKMQAMKPIMAHFKGQADGNVVRSILEEL